MPLVSGSYWPMVHGSKPEQVLEDEEGCAVMRELGSNMAWLLRCIELGKANGITHPKIPAAHDQFHPLSFPSLPPARRALYRPPTKLQPAILFSHSSSRFLFMI